MGITAANLIEALPCPVIVVDAEQAITYANGAAEYFFATSQSVLKPAPEVTGCEDHTYALARDADVTQLLRALRVTCPLARVALLTGAQK